MLYRADAGEVAILNSVVVNLSEAGEAFDSVVGCFEVVCFAEDAVSGELFEFDVVTEQEAVAAVASVTDCRSDDRSVKSVSVEVDSAVSDLFHSFYLHSVVDLVVVVAAVVDVVVCHSFVLLKVFVVEKFGDGLLHIRLISY